MTAGKKLVVTLMLVGSILRVLILPSTAKAQITVVYTRSGVSVVADPIFSPVSPYNGPATSVTISDATSGSIVNTCSDTTNTCTPSTQYTGAIPFSSTGYIRAQAYVLGGPVSNVVSWQGTYASQAATPVWSPGTGTYGSTQTGSLSCSTTSSYICYTRDGSNPVTNGSGGCTTGTLYSSSFSITSTETDNAVCNASGYTQSAQASQSVTIGTLNFVYPSLSGAGSDVFTASYGSPTNGYLLAQVISPLASYGGTQIKQLGYKFYSVGTATQCWEALYTYAGSLIASGGTFTPATSWDNTSITPYTFTDGEGDVVVVACNGTFTIYASSTVSASPGKYQAFTYSATPPSTIAVTADAPTYAARVGIQ